MNISHLGVPKNGMTHAQISYGFGAAELLQKEWIWIACII
jgi:hypothetical protein